MAGSLRTAIVGWSASVIAAAAGMGVDRFSHLLSLGLFLFALATALAVPVVLGAPALARRARLVTRGAPSPLARLDYLPVAVWDAGRSASVRPHLVSDEHQAADGASDVWLSDWPRQELALVFAEPDAAPSRSRTA